MTTGDNEFKIHGNDIYFNAKHIYIIRKQPLTSNRDDIIIKYQAIQTVISERRGFISLIFMGILFFISGFFGFMLHNYLAYFLFTISLGLIAGYFISLTKKIIIKTPAHTEIIPYTPQIYKELLKKLDKFGDK